MKKTFFSIIFIIVIKANLYAQFISLDTDSNNNFTYPKFVGCYDVSDSCTQKKLFRYIAENVKYPKEAYKAKVSGKVYTSFRINENGVVENVEVFKGVDYFLDEEAIRVILSLPDFWPGLEHYVDNNGNVISEAAPFNFIVPINFNVIEEVDIYEALVIFLTNQQVQYDSLLHNKIHLNIKKIKTDFDIHNFKFKNNYNLIDDPKLYDELKEVYIRTIDSLIFNYDNFIFEVFYNYFKETIKIHKLIYQDLLNFEQTKNKENKFDNERKAWHLNNYISKIFNINHIDSIKLEKTNIEELTIIYFKIKMLIKCEEVFFNVNKTKFLFDNLFNESYDLKKDNNLFFDKMINEKKLRENYTNKLVNIENISDSNNKINFLNETINYLDTLQTNIESKYEIILDKNYYKKKYYRKIFDY